MTVPTEPLLRHLHRLLSRPDADSASDAALLERFVSRREEAAFAALLARHGPMVYGVCRRVLHDVHDAEDVFQAAFLVLARKAETLRRPQALAGWLYGTARHLALKVRRDRARRCQHERDIRPASPSADPLDQLAARELLLALDEEMERLPETYRLPLLLCGLEGRSQEEAARILGWTIGSLKGRLERGRKQLHARLSQRGLAFSGALLTLAFSQGGTASAAALQAALAFARHEGGAISAQVVALAESAIASMAATKVKLGLALLLVTSLAAGAGALTHQLSAARQPATPREARTPSPKEIAKTEPQVPPRPRTDVLGDPLPPGAVARMGTLRLNHFGQLSCLVFSPDSKVLASAGAFGDIRLWDAANGKELRHIRAYKEPISGIAFSPDGKLLLSACYWDRTIRVWETATGKELHRMRGDPEGIDALALSRDGKLLASAGRDHSIRLWETDGWKELRRMTGHEDRVRSLVFAADGKTLLSTGVDRTIRIWDTNKGRELRSLPVGLRYFDDIALSLDGTLSAGRNYGDGIVDLWNVAEGKRIRRLKVPLVYGIAFSPDGKILATAGMDDTLRLWDVANGKELRHTKGFTCSGKVAFAPNGKVLASCTCANAGEIRFRDSATLAEVVELGGHREALAFVAFSPNGKTVRTSDINGVIGFWNATTGKPAGPMHQPPRGFIFSSSNILTPTVVSRDGEIAAAIDGGDRIQLWRPATGAVIHKIAEPPAAGKRLAFSPDGAKLAATHKDGTIRLWDAATGRQAGCFRDANAAIKSDFYFPLFSADSKTLVAAARHDGTIRVWDVKTEREIRRFKGQSMHIQFLALSADGSLLISLSSIPSSGPERVRTVCQLRNLTTGEELPLFHEQQRSFDALIFSSDGRTLATANYDGIRLWEIATGKERRRFEGHRGTAYCLAFSSDGRLLVSGGNDRTAVIWDVASIPEGDPAPKDRQALWAALGDSDAARAHKAMCSLIADRSAVPFLRKRLRPTVIPDTARIARLIADLDSDSFAVRDRAARELEKMGDVPEAALRKTVAGKPSLEVRRRVEQLLKKLRESVTNPEQLQTLRGIEVLEHIGTSEARRVLEILAQGAPCRSTREAKASRRRLAERSSREP